MKKLMLLLTVLLFSCAGIFAQTITTSPITITTKCGGDTVKVNYTITGTFTAGNIFTAQLSDAAGAFTAPVNIGTLTAVVAGSITATIPSATASGTGYKVRVVSNTPAITGTASTSTLIINAIPASPSVTPAARCATGVVTLTATPGGANEVIKWYSAATAGTLLTTANSYTTPSIAASTNYYALDSNTVTKCVASSRVAVLATVNALPAAATLAVGGNTPCGGGSATISATPAASCTLNWYAASTGGSVLANGLGVTSFNTPAITATTIYYALDSNTVTTCVAASRLAVTATKLDSTIKPVVIWARSATTKICSGVGNDTLKVTPITGVTYQWYKVINGANVALANVAPYTGVATNQLVLTTPNDTAAGNPFYVIAKKTTSGCTINSDNQTIVINPAPTVSIGSVSDNLGNLCNLNTSISFTAFPSTTSGVSYQWYKNDVLVTGATASSYSQSSWVSNDDIKCVIAVAAPGCAVSSSATSNSLTVNGENAVGNTWQVKSNIGVSKKQSAASFSIGNKGYLVGGTDNGVGTTANWEYDPFLNSWTQKADFPGAIRITPAYFAIGNYGYVGGGTNNTSVANNIYYADYYKYYPPTNSWTQVADQPMFGATPSPVPYGFTPCGGTAANPNTSQTCATPVYSTTSFSIGKKGYVVGGDAGYYGAADPRKETWIYDPTVGALGTWTRGNDYPNTNTMNLTSFVIGNNAYVGGGLTGGSSTASDTYAKLDGATNLWSAIANNGLSGTGGYKIGFMGSFTIGMYGYIFGGYNNAPTGGLSTPYFKARKYDPVANTWTALPDMPNNAFNGGFTIGNKGYSCNTWGTAVNVGGTGNYINEYTPNGLTIKTGPIVNTSLCLGSTINVPYSLGCNSTTSFAGDFIVQLSDSLGTFLNPTEIGRAAVTNGAGTSGSISATIPTNSKLSNQYRIRIVSESSSSPATNTIGYMNDALVTVGTVPTGGEIGIDHTVPYPAELTSDAINNVTLPNTSVIALSSTKPYTWQKTTNTISGTWTNIENANGINYELPLTAQVDTFYRRLANFACLASVPSNVVGIKVFSAANNKLNGSISGMVKTPLLTGVAGINITIQKTSGDLLGSPITKVYTTTTGNDGKYIIPNIFYGDINNGDPSTVTYIVKAFKVNHDIQNSAGVEVTLSNTNAIATNIDFTDYSVVSIKGAVTTSMNGIDGGDMDSVNSVRINVTRVNGGSAEIPDTTGSQGYGKYAINVVDQIPYRFTPVYKNHKFVPAYRDVNVTENIFNIDFYDSTFNTISGVFKASGGSEIIGRATLKFEDTVNKRPGVKFTKIITTNEDGTYSVTLPARKYKVTVMSFIPANNQTNDINPTELLEFFNIRQKDSSIINIDTMNRTKNFIYHRKPVLTFQNLPDSCGKKVFRQNQSKTFIVNIWEGDPFHNYKVVTDSTDSLRLVSNVTGDVNLDTMYYNQKNGSDTITLKGGSPNSLSFENYLKTFKLDYTDKFGRSATTLAPLTIVLGLKTNRGTFITVSPEVPLLILHAPPGDKSSSVWTQNTTNETEMSLSFDMADERLGESAVSFGVKALIGFGFSTATDVDATVTNSITQRTSIRNTTTAVFSTSSSTSYSTEPGGGDVYVGAALNLKYAVADELIFNDTASHACELFNKSRFVVAPDGFATTYTYSEGQIKSVIVPTLQAMADNASSVAEQKRYQNQVRVWNQVVNYNTRNKARASFIRNRSFDGNAGPIVESTTESSSFKNTLEFNIEVEESVAVACSAKVSNTGIENKVAMSMKLGLGGSIGIGTTRETTIGYTLDDDDEGDYFSVDIKKDPVYKTPVFELVAGTSSCPAEEIAQNRDSGRLDIPEEVNGMMNKIQTNIPSGNEAIYQLKLRNLSESRETRKYNLAFDQSSNPNGAIVTIGGNPSNVPVSYTIPYLGTQIVTVTVKKNAFSNVYSYEGLRFIMKNDCGSSGKEVSSNTLSAYFASPCSNITFVSPTEGWLSNASGNNIIPISFNGYNVNNLQSVTLQYAHTGRGDWLPGLVLNQNAISNTGTQNANWNISNVEDGNYEIRLQLLCANGTVFSTRYAGLIDRKAPQLFGAPQPADRLLSLGDDISYSFDENIVTSGLGNNVKLTKINNNTEIPIQVTGYGNRVNIVPATDLFANYYGDTLRLVIKNISDLNGNTQTESDTLEFLVGGTSLPVVNNVKKKRVSISNVNPTRMSIFENSGDSLMVKFKFDTASNTTSRTLVRYIIGGTAQYNSGYTVSYSNGQTLATVYDGTEGSITIPAYQDSAILVIKPIADAINELDETVTLSLISGGDYTISDNYQIKDSIINDDNLGTPVITSSGQLCQGGSITLSTDNMIDGQPVNRYEWKLGSTIVGTAQNQIVTTSGDYSVTVYNSGSFSGTSTVFAVTASEPPTSTSNVSVCSNQLPYSWNNAYYSAAGTFTKTISNADGCDSIAVLNLTISAPISTVETINAVDSFEWHGNMYYASTNIATWTGTNAAGCDSLVTLNLIITYSCLPVSTELYVTACNSYMWRGMRFYSSAEIEWIGATSRGGCDSVVTLHLTINRTTRSTTNVSLCSSQLPYSWNGLTCNAAGTYTKQMTNAAGCDSIATLVLSVKLPTSSTQNVAVCANDMPYTWNGVEYNTAGTYVQNFTNAAGCDSTATLVLSVKQVSTSNNYLSICSSQLPIVWNGLTLTSSGNYIANLNNANGCDSLAILNLTVKQVSYVTETINATGTSYTWHGVVYTSSNNTATWTGTNVAGCDSIVTLDLTLTNDCVPTTRIINVTACSTYTWRGIRLTSSTTLEWVGVNAGGCDSIEVLNLTITSLSPTASPASITQTLVSNVCGARVYRYTASEVTNASGYSWLLPVSVGGIVGVFVDSGNATSSRVILVRYASTLAAFTTDSVKVKAFSPCGGTSYRSAKLINTLFTVPAAPASITITPIETKLCGAKRYRFTAPVLPIATTTTVAATGYVWAFTGVLDASIDSGTVNSKVITVTFSSNAAAATGDSVKLCYTSSCGNSLNKASKLTNTLLSAPAAPTVTVSAVQTNVCGARKYRYKASNLALATTTTGAATGWLWSLPAEGAVGSTGTLDSGTVNSQTIVVVYTSNAAAAAGDSIRVRFTSNCGLGLVKATKLTNTALTAPLAPATVTIATVSDICGARVYRYTAPTLPLATATAGAATGYVWSMPIGTLGSNGVLDSGSLTGRIIRIRYSSNVAAVTGDSIKVLYTSNCGNSLAKAQKLSNVAPTLLAASTTLTGTTSICSIVGTSTSARYTATSVTGAQYYVWSLPSGAVIDSGSNGLKIRVRFNTAGANDSIFVQAVGINGCAGTKKVLKLVTTGCVTLPTTRTVNYVKPAEENMLVNVYPNPTTSTYQLYVQTSQLSQTIKAKVFDVQGRLMKVLSFNSNETITFGSDLKSGVYIVEVREGDKVRTLRVVKY